MCRPLLTAALLAPHVVDDFVVRARRQGGSGPGSMRSTTFSTWELSVTALRDTSAISGVVRSMIG